MSIYNEFPMNVENGNRAGRINSMPEQNGGDPTQGIPFKRQPGGGGLLVPADQDSQTSLVIGSARALDTTGFGGMAATVQRAVAGRSEAEAGESQSRVLSIGWSDTVEVGGLGVTLPPVRNGDRFDVVHMPLDESERELYMDGFANRVLWFLSHGLLERCKVDQESFNKFEEKNRDAARVMAHYSQGRTLWVHDFQMWLVPEFVRELNPEQEIGYFHHIPFERSEVFRWLKNYGEDVPARFLKALLANDIVGFQTIDDLSNFRECLKEFVPEAQINVLAADDMIVQVGDRKISVGAFPISIDVEEIDREANEDGVQEATEALQAQFPEQTLALNVGRGDEVKKIHNAIAAQSLIHQQHADTRGRLTQVVVAPKSRQTMQEYRDYSEQIRRQAELINSIDWGVTGWKPIIYNDKGIRGTQRVAHWKASQIGLYPTVDGMNVSVLEQLIARDKTRKFVPIVGQRTGARVRLENALIVDGDDAQSIADALYAAYIMPEDEARARADHMEQMLRRDTVYDWVAKYMARLAQARELRAS